MASLPDNPGIRDFDFLFGSWRVANERLVSRLTGSDVWERFEAGWTCRPILGGLGNIDEVRPDWPGRDGFEAIALRLFDRATGRWSIWWADNAQGVLEPPVVGGFADGVGEFYGDDRHDGRSVRVRFRWSGITANAARWEQAFSADGGTSWETNWIMSFERTGKS